MATADRAAPVTGVRPVLRRGAACLACATLLAFGASGCKSPVTPAAVPASPAAKAPAANSAGRSGVKRSIVNLVSAYLKLRESLNGTIDSAIEKRVLANTSNLKSGCGS
jgi:hypothetical protein